MSQNPLHATPVLAPERLDAYLDRLGLPGRGAPTLETLDAIIAAQLRQIPFENVDPLLGLPVPIEPDAVFDKLVVRRRGGYCFEQNTLLAAALAALGFDVAPLAARVRWGLDESTPSPQSHLLLHVRVAHRDYIADAGFGGPTPPGALPLSEPVAEGMRYRLAAAPLSAVSSGSMHLFDLECEGDGGWFKLYRFDLSPQQWIDYQARNWYVSTHPQSIFTGNLLVARTDGSTRLTMRNNELTEREPDGTVRNRRLETPQAVVEVLRERFGLALDAATDEALARRLQGLM
ncbi:arylamine N-acetyltransferase [Cupriavidus sp. AU9028]|uniref:arylamine N-acetyltransferase family protein n=1 Tax=Cupriavidus sp. AU9028 TaxID=2871157 RepID=UPI001C983794|nr:arylamine N-acetyltransferase [Cupriavidus sp. AU9028]MBY4895996.1 arylamine N-acetyltransferase [Cupriavidus sp. AU9028]